MQLGQILLHIGIATADQIEAALRQQVVYGGRLGTNLIELGYATPDQIAQALGRQHRVPAALERHLTQHDHGALRVLPREVVVAHTAFPIAFSMSEGRRLVVCFRDPQKIASVRAIARIAQLEVIPTAAPELSIYYWLEQCYGVERARRFVHARAGRSQPLPRAKSDVHQIVQPDDDDFSIDVDLDDEVVGMPDHLQLVDLDHRDVAKDTSLYQHDTRQNNSLMHLAELAHKAEEAETRAQPVAVPATPVEEPAPPVVAPRVVPPPIDPSTLAAAAAVAAQAAAKFVPKAPAKAEARLSAAQAIAAVDQADDRNAVLAATLAFMRHSFGAALITIAKDSLALGAMGFGGSFDQQTVESIVIPLNLPSCFEIAHRTAEPFHGPPPETGRAVQDRFFKLFGSTPPEDVTVVPVSVRSRVVCLLYAHNETGELDDALVDQLSLVSDAVGEAFVRLIRGRKKD